MNTVKVIAYTTSSFTILIGISHLVLHVCLIVVQNVHNSWHERYKDGIEGAPGYHNDITHLLDWSKIVTLSTGILLVIIGGGLIFAIRRLANPVADPKRR